MAQLSYCAIRALLKGAVQSATPKADVLHKWFIYLGIKQLQFGLHFQQTDTSVRTGRYDLMSLPKCAFITERFSAIFCLTRLAELTSSQTLKIMEALQNCFTLIRSRGQRPLRPDWDKNPCRSIGSRVLQSSGQSEARRKFIPIQTTLLSLNNFL